MASSVATDLAPDAFAPRCPALIYIGVSLGQPEPIAYVLAHVLKVLGGTADGFVALKRATANSISMARPA